MNNLNIAISRSRKAGALASQFAGRCAVLLLAIGVTLLLVGLSISVLLANNAHEVAVRTTKHLGRLIASAVASVCWSAKRFWKLWIGGLASKTVFYCVAILLGALLLVVVVEVALYFRSASPRPTFAKGAAIVRLMARGDSILIVIGAVSLWTLLKFTASSTLVVLVFTRNWATTVMGYLIRLLASIPTLILGNGALFLAGVIGIRPGNPIQVGAFIVSALTLIGLPTVLHIGKEVFRDYDKRQLQQAVALGINRIFIGHKVALPTVRRTFNAAVTFAVSRIIIEGYIVIHQTLAASPSPHSLIGEPRDILHVFYGVYSTMTIQSNVVLILVLFSIALVVNAWSFDLISGPGHQ